MDFPAQAQALLSDKAYKPAFFEKLASDWNIQPRTQQEADELLIIGQELRAKYDAQQVKQASTSVVSEALSALNKRLGYPDVNVQAKAAAVAQKAVEDPTVIDAACQFLEFMNGA